jgi:magnesium transporter
VALVTFIPIVSAMSGNVGLQSATLVIRGLATGHLSTHDLRRLCLREVRVAFLMGMVCGGAVLLISTLGPWQPMLGVVVGVSMLLAFLISAAIATATPLLLSRAGIDPAIAATPFVSTINDITSMSIYMTIATMLVAYLT